MKNIFQLLQAKKQNRSARAIAPDGDGKIKVETPHGIRSVVNSTGQTITADRGVVIAGDDNTIVGVEGFRSEPYFIRIRG